MKISVYSGYDLIVDAEQRVLFSNLEKDERVSLSEAIEVSS